MTFVCFPLSLVGQRAEKTRKTKSGGGGGVISVPQVSTSVFTLFWWQKTPSTFPQCIPSRASTLSGSHYPASFEVRDYVAKIKKFDSATKN